MYIEAENGLMEADTRAAVEFSDQALASREERYLISNAMQRALQVILNYQRDHQSLER